jgi:putative ABC transport system permease protein
MRELVAVAIRNVARNRRRTLITVITVFIGVVVATVTRGLLDGLQAEIQSNLTRKVHGDLQIHKRGYQDSLESQPYQLLIPEPGPGLGLVYAPRLKVMALLNHQRSQTTTPVMITGIDSVQEAKVCPRLAGSIQIGSMLDSTQERLPSQVANEELTEAVGLGEPVPAIAGGPKAEGFQQIMLTPSLQRGLGASLGDELIVLVADKDNMQQAIVTRFVGVIDVGIPGAAARMAWMDFMSLQKLLGVEGLASELALRIPEDRDVEAERDRLQVLVPGDQLVETWRDLGGFLRDSMAVQDIIFSAIVAIMFAIVIAAIVNTSLMTVMERTREIGTLMALGYRRRHILFMFLTESAFIGGLGGVTGLMVGVSLVGFFHTRGLTITLPGQTVSTVLYPAISPTFIILIFSLSISAALIAGFLPAWRASHMKPVTALSGN